MLSLLFSVYDESDLQFGWFLGNCSEKNKEVEGCKIPGIYNITVPLHVIMQLLIADCLTEE